MARGRAQGASALLALARLDGSRGRDRDHRRGTGRLDRPDLVRARLGDRGLRQPRHRLALHRLTPALTRRRRTGPEAGRDPVLPARPVRRLRGSAQTRHRRAAADELARDRARHLEPDRDALPRHREAAARRQARLGRDPG